MGSEAEQLTIRTCSFEKSDRLRKVGKVEFFEVFSRPRMREASHIVTGTLVSLVYGTAKHSGCPCR